MAKAWKKVGKGNTQKVSQGGGAGKDYYAGLPKETSGGKTYAIEPTGEKTLIDEEGDPVMDIEINPHLYPEYVAKFANNPNPDVEFEATPAIRDTQDMMAYNQKYNRQEENARNRKAFRKEIKFQQSLQSSGEDISGSPRNVAKGIIYPTMDETVWQNQLVSPGSSQRVADVNLNQTDVPAGFTTIQVPGEDGVMRRKVVAQENVSPGLNNPAQQNQIAPEATGAIIPNNEPIVAEDEEINTFASNASKFFKDNGVEVFNTQFDFKGKKYTVDQDGNIKSL